MIDLASITDGLVRTSGTRWDTRSASGEVISYPPADSDLCFSVEESSFWFAHRNDVIVAAVNRTPPLGAICDIGGGNGFVAKALDERGYDTVLVEPSRDGAAHAVSRGLRNVVCGTVADARFHPRTLGAAGLFDVVEHIENDVAFLRMLRPILMEGAPLYITVPAGPRLWSFDDEVAGHFRRYTRATLTEALRASGFEVVYMTYFFSFLVLPVALFRSVPYRLGRRRGPDAHSIRREHAANAGGKVISRLLAVETDIVAHGRSLPFGASILAVAR